MPRRTDKPEPGYYLIRLVKNGPPVGAEIIHDDAGQWWTMVDDVLYGPARDPFQLETLCQVHSYGVESTQSEVAYRIELSRWAKAYSPNHPAANPKRPVDTENLIPF